VVQGWFNGLGRADLAESSVEVEGFVEQMAALEINSPLKFGNRDLSPLTLFSGNPIRPPDI
jgi:hypothetical protein